MVAVFGIFGEEFEDDGGEAVGDIIFMVVGRERALGDVEMDEGEGVVGDEGRGAGEEFVEGGAEGVEIGTMVNGAIHATCLFWG